LLASVGVIDAVRPGRATKVESWTVDIRRCADVVLTTCTTVPSGRPGTWPAISEPDKLRLLCFVNDMSLSY
jgi:hypothetical protein